MHFGCMNATSFPMDHDLARRPLPNDKTSACDRILLREEERTPLARSLALHCPSFSKRDYMYGLGHWFSSHCTRDGGNQTWNRDHGKPGTRPFPSSPFPLPAEIGRTS